MTIIQEPNKAIINIYNGLFSKMNDDKEYRFHKYCLFVDNEKGITIYNVLTKACVLIEKDEDPFQDIMFQYLFFVEMGFADEMLVYYLRQAIIDSRPKIMDYSKINSYTILPTTNCNARCFYCYEKNGCKNDMSEKTANDVADFIIDNHKNNNNITISWFGGEPLFNYHAIDIITKKLNQNNVRFNSTMVTNGYLFNKRIIKKATNDWHLYRVQITIDGTSQNYNKTKNYTNANKNPFDKVIKNIQQLTDSNIVVTIRLNVGYYNADDLIELADYLHKKFNNNKKLSIYVHELFENNPNDITSVEKQKYVFNAINTINQKLYEYGMQSKKTINNDICSTHCMCDSRKSLVISPKGDIGVCEHYIDSNFIGSIYSLETNDTMLQKLSELKEPFESCITCPLFPECHFLKYCDANYQNCTEERKNFKINELIKAIKNKNRYL